MKNRKDIHLTDENTALYIRYLFGKTEKTIDSEMIEAIQRHIYNCEECMTMLQKRFESTKNEMEGTGLTCSETADKAIAFEVVKTLKQFNLTESKSSLLDSILECEDDFDNSAVFAHMNTIRFGKRIGSRLSFQKQSDRFAYDKVKDPSRGSAGETIVETYMKIIESGNIREKVAITLNTSEKQILVRLKNEDFDYAPRIALIRIDEIPEEKHLRIADVLYNGADDSFEYKFEDLEQGDYFVFIEPQLLI